MISGIWIRPDDPDEEDCLIIEYADGDQSYRMLLDGNGDMLPMDGNSPDTWTRVIPVPGLHQEINGDVTGTSVQAGNIGGGLTVN